MTETVRPQGRLLQSGVVDGGLYGMSHTRRNVAVGLLTIGALGALVGCSEEAVDVGPLNNNEGQFSSRIEPGEAITRTIPTDRRGVVTVDEGVCNPLDFADYSAVASAGDTVNCYELARDTRYGMLTSEDRRPKILGTLAAGTNLGIECGVEYRGFTWAMIGDPYELNNKFVPAKELRYYPDADNTNFSSSKVGVPPELDPCPGGEPMGKFLADCTWGGLGPGRADCIEP